MTRQRHWQPILIVVALLLASITTGCDSGPSTAPVHGKVTFDGSPVTSGTIQFHSSASGTSAYGGLRPDGTYQLSRKVPGDEVVLGEYKVTIEAFQSGGEAREGEPISVAEELKMELSNASSATSKPLVPVEYASIETTPLMATVAEGDNEINFELP